MINKTFLLIAFSMALLTGCRDENGELLGIPGGPRPGGTSEGYGVVEKSKKLFLLAGTESKFALGDEADPYSSEAQVEIAPQKGTLTLSGGEGTYAAPAEASGQDCFAYRYMNPKSVSVRVSTCANIAPIAEDRALSIRHREVVVEQYPAMDPDGDPLTVDIESAPSKGEILFNHKGQSIENGFYYNPKGLEIGTDAFSYSVSDGRAQSDTKTVTIELQPQLEGTWLAADALGNGPQLFKRGESVPFTCAKHDIVISHSADRVQIPAFTISCDRNAEHVEFSRPAIDMVAARQSSDSHRYFSEFGSTTGITPGTLSSSLNGYLLYSFGGADMRTIQGFNSEMPQQVKARNNAYGNGLVLIEAFGDYQYVSALHRLTP